MTKLERINLLRQKGLGLWEAKGVVEREDRIAAIDAAQTIDDIKQLLREMVYA